MEKKFYKTYSDLEFNRIRESIYTTTYKVLDKSTGQVYFSKAYHGINVRTNLDKLLINEVKILEILPEHIGFIKYLGSLRYRDSVYLFFPYYQYALHDLFNLTPSIISHFASDLSLIYQIIHQIEKLHKLGITHRDIKPGNILLDLENQTIVLTDFGISQIKGQTKAIEKAFTRGYAPPEQLNDQSTDVLYSEDLWALGIICLYILNPEHVLKTRNAVNSKALLDVVNQIVEDCKKQNIPGLLLRCITELLVLDPKKRLHNFKILVQDFTNKTTTTDGWFFLKQQVQNHLYNRESKIELTELELQTECTFETLKANISNPINSNKPLSEYSFDTEKKSTYHIYSSSNKTTLVKQIKNTDLAILIEDQVYKLINEKSNHLIYTFPHLIEWPTILVQNQKYIVIQGVVSLNNKKHIDVFSLKGQRLYCFKNLYTSGKMRFLQFGEDKFYQLNNGFYINFNRHITSKYFSVYHGKVKDKFVLLLTDGQNFYLTEEHFNAYYKANKGYYFTIHRVGNKEEFMVCNGFSYDETTYNLTKELAQYIVQIRFEKENDTLRSFKYFAFNKLY